MPRIERERKTVETMISMYCRDKHGSQELCPDCTRLRDYAFSRLKSCRYGETKPTCSKCRTHCYKPDYREQIRSVMRYAGPRMTYRHPVLAFLYLQDRVRSGKNNPSRKS